MSKRADDVRLWKLGKRRDPEHLLRNLERCGAEASAFLLPSDKRLARWESDDTIRIPVVLADAIAALLFSLPRLGKTGRRKIWSADTENRALCGLLDDRPVNALAREISQETGQAVPSTRRRLQEMKNSDQLKKLKVITRNGLGLTRALRHLQLQDMIARQRASRISKKRNLHSRAK